MDSNDIIQIVSHNLKRKRIAAGLSQGDIAAFIDVTFQQVQKYENGKNRIPVDKLYILSRKYGVLVDSFFTQD